MKPVFKRVLLKLSGEVLAGEKGTGIDFDKVIEVCRAVKDSVDMGVQVAIVVGGGNFWRGMTGQLFSDFLQTGGYAMPEPVKIRGGRLITGLKSAVLERCRRLSAGCIPFRYILFKIHLRFLLCGC